MLSVLRSSAYHQMAALEKAPLAEDSYQREINACDLVADAKNFLPDKCGPVFDKESSIRDTSNPARNAGSPNQNPCDLVRETGSPKIVSDDLVKDARSPAADSCHLVSEMEALHAALKQKDLLIASLQTQLVSVCQSRSSREAERAARERERTLLLDRSTHLQHQIDRRRAHVKNARLTLEQIDTVERNIDDCIRRAELEYHLETEELNILNLQGDHMRLRSRLDGARDGAPSPPAVSLSSCLPSHADVSLHCLTVPYDLDSPCFTVTQAATEAGLLVDWASDRCGLSTGDRLLEVNGQQVLGSSSAALQRLLADSGSPLRLLAVRCRPPSLGRRGPAGPALRQELALLAGRLQQKTRQNKTLHAETQRCAGETAAYRADNDRLVRRVRQLEQRVQQMQGVLDKIRGVTDESLRSTQEADCADTGSTADSSPPSRIPDGASDHEHSPVFARGPHTATISVNVSGAPSKAPLSLPSLPASPARHPPSLPASPAGHPPPLPASPARHPSLSPHSAPAAGAVGGERPAFVRQLRPLPAPRPRSLLQRLQLYGERRLQGAAASLQRPRPPQKPARLSLQRAVSLQTLQQAEAEVEAEAEGVRRPPRPAVQTWPSMDGNLEMVRQRARGVRVRHQICSLPRPGRLAATRPVPI